ncbi:zinc-dependent metalloprotease [Arsenicicoccus dermatophilus]|uniref:zinc-dependent metalloprotease n=1 Tax=Arsenicicoccus dermatophilus TaxID=1076331 RepID=UPI003916CEAE
MSTPPNPGAGKDPDEDDLARMLGEMLGDPSLAADPRLREMLARLGAQGLEPAQLAMVQQQVRAMFTGPAPDGPVDGALALDLARKRAASTGDQVVCENERRDCGDAIRVAQMWLDQVTDLEAPATADAVWSRAEWVEATLPTWVRLVGPVADGVTGAMTGAMRSQLDELGRHGGLETFGTLPGMPALPAGMDATALMAQMGPMVQRMGATMFAAQIGEAVGGLAGEVVSGTEVGLPLVPDHAVALLPAGVAAFGEGLQIDPAQVRLYLAARESARSRLFAGRPWLGAALTSAVTAYARDISIDVEGIQTRMATIDPTDPEALQAAVGQDLFTPEPSAAQRRALASLETLLALVEGWVDVVTDRATRGHLPEAAALGEAVRRRRATGGPAERTLAQLVGLELRPRRLRDAANLFAALEEAGGSQLRDGAWAHPDLSPTGADLDDVLGYVERVRAGGGDDLDAELDRLLASGGAGDGSGDGTGGGTGPTPPGSPA